MFNYEIMHQSFRLYKKIVIHTSWTKTLISMTEIMLVKKLIIKFKINSCCKERERASIKYVLSAFAIPNLNLRYIFYDKLKVLLYFISMKPFFFAEENLY